MVLHLHVLITSSNRKWYFSVQI